MYLIQRLTRFHLADLEIIYKVYGDLIYDFNADRLLSWSNFDSYIKHLNPLFNTWEVLTEAEYLLHKI